MGGGGWGWGVGVEGGGWRVGVGRVRGGFSHLGMGSAWSRGLVILKNTLIWRARQCVTRVGRNVSGFNIGQLHICFNTTDYCK